MIGIGLALRQRRGGGEAFSPISLSPTIWYDDSGLFFQDTPPVTPATADTELVRVWNDRSGNSYHLTAGNDTTRPTLQTAEQNDLAAILFDGTSDYMDSPVIGAGFNGLTGITKFFVVKNMTPSGGGGILAWLGNTATAEHNTSVLLQVTGDVIYDAMSRTNGEGANAYGYCAYDSTAWRIVRSVYDGTQADNASRLKLYFNGVQQSLSFSNNIPATAVGHANNKLRIGCRLTSPSLFWPGYVAEVLIYPTALSADNQTLVETYLNTRWAVY
jgi:hypothetical protein